jgi:hypothetical protein
MESRRGPKEGQMEDKFEKVMLAADFGAGQQADIEFQAPNTLWVAAGSGIEVADIWMKDVNGVIDLRVRVMRLRGALEVSVDRGEQSKSWWPEDAVPRLLIVLDRAEGTATVTASVGPVEQPSNVQSGRIPY